MHTTAEYSIQLTDGNVRVRHGQISLQRRTLPRLSELDFNRFEYSVSSGHSGFIMKSLRENTAVSLQPQ